MNADSDRTELEALGRSLTRRPESFGAALRVWLAIGCLSFGGPTGQIALMHRVLVDERRWIDEARFLHALNFCMLLPGPEATQLAAYVGWLMHGVRGGLAAGLLFVLPGALVMLGLSLLYIFARGVTVVEGALFGIKAAVLVIVAEAVLRIGRRALQTPLLVGIAVASFLAIFAAAFPFPLIVLAAAVIGYGVAHWDPKLLGLEPASAALPPHPRRWPMAALASGIGLLAWWAPAALAALSLGTEHVLVGLGVFFSKLAVVSFGGAYALMAYMAQQVVEAKGWLAASEMIDGLGLAETTPGPLILVSQFVGTLAAFRAPAPFPPIVAALLGAGITLWSLFTPSFLFIFAGAPFIEDLRGNKRLAGALAAITAAVVGVILNLAVWFALHVLFAKVTETVLGPLRWFSVDGTSLDAGAALLAAVAAAIVFWLRAGMAATVAVMAALGIAWRFALPL